MLPSMRHFLRFIDADDKFNSFGFVQKVFSFFLRASFEILMADAFSTAPLSNSTLASVKDVRLARFLINFFYAYSAILSVTNFVSDMPDNYTWNVVSIQVHL
jgi:hypothetical protein